MPDGSDLILERLLKLHPKKIDLTLDRIRLLLDKLDRPQDRLPPVVHVAGTNGKGSVIAFLRAMLEAAGYRVHAYTSPHLVRFAERIRLAGEIIDEAALTARLADCERVNGGDPITFFEITTAAAYLAFAETPADILLLECGLGGRLDATNVIDRPAATVLTPIGMDHMAFFGDSLPLIAAEKAAILKSGVPGLIGRQPEAAMAVIEAKAREVGAPLIRAGREFRFAAAADGIAFEDTAPLRLPRPNLIGAHQVHNAALAVACARRLDGFRVPDAAMAAGLTRAEWPARLQRLDGHPLALALPGDSSLWLDGGHNPDAGAALAETLRDWSTGRDALPLHLVFGMLNTKDAPAFLAPLAPLAQSLSAIAIPGETASLTAEEAAAAARSAGVATVRTAPDAAAALDAIAAAATGPVRVLICGSLYLAGQILAQRSLAPPPQ